MEHPLDGNELDIEGFASIIVGDNHKLLVEELGTRLAESLTAVEQLRDSFAPIRYLVCAIRMTRVPGGQCHNQHV